MRAGLSTIKKDGVIVKITERDDCIIIHYRRPRGGKRKDFDLCLDYLNGTEVSFTLTAERQKDGLWRVFRAIIDTEETEMITEAVRDLTFLRWYIFPRKERRRILPPIVALWDVGNLTVAACLSPEMDGKSLSLAQQEEWFSETCENEPPDSDRLLCWWPESVVWKDSKDFLKDYKLTTVDVSFFTFSQWKQRTDVKCSFEELESFPKEYKSFGAEFSGDFDEEIHSEIAAEILTEEYINHIRCVRTSLAFFKKHGIPVRVTLGNAEYASAFFTEKGLDPDDPAAWSQVSLAFPEMPEFVLEEIGSSGPLGVVTKNSKLKAVITCYSHYPNSPVIDLVAATVYMGSQNLVTVACWLNPLKSVDPTATEKAVNILLEELSRRGVKEISVIDGVLPFKVCSCCKDLAFFVPDELLMPVQNNTNKIGRNDPCSCGSGLKYKKCCGKSFIEPIVPHL